MNALRTRLVLVVSIAGAMIVALDGTILVVAQPSLQRDVGADVAQVQWSSTSYLLAVAALLVVAGRLGDRYGHRRLLLAGVAGFGVSSVGIAFAPGIGWVIALRAVQGVFAALLQPATLALLRVAYPAERLGAAVAVRTSAIGVASAAGPVVGGALVAHAGWRAVFVLNVPVAAVVVALTLAVRAPSATPDRARGTDVAGGLLLTGTLAVLVHTLVGVRDHGWTSPATLLGFAAVGCLALVLVRYERRASHPIVPSPVARSVPVMASMTLLLLIAGSMFGALFVGTFLFQDLLGLDPLTTGLRVLPLTATMVAGAPVANLALRRVGPRAVATTGVALVALGVAGLSLVPMVDGWLVTGTVLAVLGAGFTTVMVTATGTVVGDAPPAYAGVVGGLKQTAMNVGPALGIALGAGAMVPHATSVGALLALAALGALGVVPARMLPGRRLAAMSAASSTPSTGRSR